MRHFGASYLRIEERELEAETTEDVLGDSGHAGLEWSASIGLTSLPTGRIIPMCRGLPLPRR
jgi:hypothetical protein